MKRLIGLLSLFLFAAVSVFSQTPSEEEWDWVNERFFDVYEKLFPIVESRGSFSISYRSYRDLYHNEFERAFYITTSKDQTMLEFRLREPLGKSIYDQIMELHQQDKSLPIEQIIPRLKMSERLYSQRNCPAIQSQYVRFFNKVLPQWSKEEKVSPKIFQKKEMSATIVLHPRIHEFHIKGSSSEISLTTRFDDNPLVYWAKQSVDVFKKCR